MTEAAILDFMRAWRAELTADMSAVRRDIGELITRVGRLEREIASLHVDYATMQGRIDNVNIRLDRIERRLELEPHA